jgi:hypothetical protein
VFSALEEQHHRRLDRWDALITIGLVVFIAVLFVLFLERPRLSDPLVYFYSAGHINQIEPTHRQLRIGLIWPIWAVMRVFGYSELSYHFVPAVAALLLSLSTWFVGRFLFNRWVGCVAGISIVYNPWVLKEFTEPLPDYLAVGLFTTAIALLLWCWRTGRLNEAPLRSSTIAVLAGAGLACGWSYLAREFVVIFFPLVPFLLFAAGSRYVALLPIAAAALACWLAELSWGMLKFGDPFARLHAASPPRTGWAGMFVETDPILILAQLPRIFLDTPGGLAFVALLLGGAAFSVVWSALGDRRWQLIALWLIGGWLFFTTVAMLPVLLLGDDGVYLRMQKFRYWVSILPPMLVAGLAFAQYFISWIATAPSRLGNTWVPNFALGILTCLLLLNSTTMALSVTTGRTLVLNGGNRDYREFRQFISKTDVSEELILLSSPRNAANRAIPIYLNSWNGLERMWTGTVKSVREDDLDRLPRDGNGSLIVLDLTKTKKSAEAKSVRRGYPSDLVKYLDNNLNKEFESSSGYVLAYTWRRQSTSRNCNLAVM